MSRAALLDSYYLLSCALVLTLFLFQKGQGFFPSLPIAALLPRSWRWAGSTNASWDDSMQLGRFCGAENRLGCCCAVYVRSSHLATAGCINTIWIFL